MPIVRTIRPPGAFCCDPNTCSMRARIRLLAWFARTRAKTTGPEFGLDLGQPISAVIAGVALIQQPIQLLAVRSVAEEAAAMLLDPARIAVLLPQLGGLLLPSCRCAPSLQLGVLITTVPLRRHRHDTGVDDLPATRHVTLGRKMLVEQLFDQPGLGQLLAEQPKRRGVRNAVLNREPQKARE